MAENKREKMAQLVVLTAERETLRRFVLSKPKSPDLAKKVSARLTVQRGRKILFFEESYPGGRVRQFALSPEEIPGTLPALMENYLQADLLTPSGDAVLLRSKKGTETLRGESNIRREQGDAPLISTLTTLDREPKRILTGSEPFLLALGVSDERGRVHDKRQPKFRQINRFLELVSDIYPELPAGDAPVLVYDLCCGKSYLSFALYHYLTAVKGRRVEMLCVDLKADVIAFCSAYNGDFWQRTWSYTCRSYLVGCTVGTLAKDVSGPSGEALFHSHNYFQTATVKINTNYRVCHLDHNWSGLQKAVDKYGLRVTVRNPGAVGCVTLLSNDPELKAGDVVKEFGLEEWDDYYARSVRTRGGPLALPRKK